MKKQSKFAKAKIAKRKPPSLNEIHAYYAEHHKKNLSYYLSHNNYRGIELRHSFHLIDSIALTQAGVNQLPGSTDVNNRAVSVGSSGPDNCRNF